MNSDQAPATGDVMPAPRAGRRGAERPVPALHTPLLALFFVISLYAHNAQSIPPGEVLRPLVLVVSSTLALLALLGAVLRNGHKAALLLSGFLFLFCSHLYLVRLLWDVAADFGFIASPTMMVLGLSGIVFGGLCVAILRTKRALGPLTAVLNVTTASLVLLPASTSVAAIRLSTQKVGMRAASGAPAPRPDLPDIYYIILDAYGRADALHEVFGIDNALFVRALEKRGFVVAHRSRANYNQTVLSLAASLNMRYLDAEARRLGPLSKDRFVLVELIDRNEVARRLKGMGYRTVYVSTGLDTPVDSSADLYLHGPERRINAFEGLFLQTTPLSALPDATLYEQHRQTVVAAFHHLEDMPAEPGPLFVFAHIYSPHPPFIFGPHGEARDPQRRYSTADASQYFQRGGTESEYRTGYRDQLAYINERVLQAVDSILRRSRRPPIIIVQGDHGSRMTMDWEGLGTTYPKEVFSNLTAFYVPRNARKDVYPEISPVNAFRLILRDCFGQPMDLLPDRSFYATVHQPYAFTDVTDRTEAPARFALHPTIRRRSVSTALRIDFQE